MALTEFAPRRKPRQFGGFPSNPFIPGLPSRLLNPTPPAPTPPAATSQAGFFTPEPAPEAAPEPAAGEPQVTLTASSLEPVATAPAPVATEPAEAAPEPTDLLTAAPQPEVDVGEVDVGGVVPVATETAAATGTQSTAVAVADQNAAVTASPGGIAIGSIAGIAFFISLLFLLYKWRKGTLPQTLQSATRALKFRPSTPTREADTMEKGLKVETSSIHSETASIHTISSLKRTFSSLKRSPSSASSRHTDISGPTAFEGQQADKLAVPLPLHLARLEAAGLWTNDGSETRERVVEGAKMDPKPVVEEPDVHPLRAHRVRTGEEEKQPAWPLQA